nr:MAG TPA: hypothetical protein [Caudoviricetes sp.]
MSSGFFLCSYTKNNVNRYNLTFQRQVHLLMLEYNERSMHGYD